MDRYLYLSDRLQDYWNVGS